MVDEITPTRRLVTQNLIVSAVMAEHTDESGEWSQIEDLAALIDSYCLFDEIHVLGRQRNVLGYLESPISELLSGHVLVDEVSDDLLTRVRPIAAVHYKTFYGDHAKAEDIKLDSFEDADFTEQRLYAQPPRSYIPAPYQDTYGRVRVDLQGPQSFFGRAFLYLAYSEVTRIPFTPDRRRASILADIIRPEEEIAGELSSILRNQYAEGHKLFSNIRRRITPLAAVVFDRAKGDRRAIAVEMQRLRDELTKLRARIRIDEHKMWYGSFREAQRAERRWQLAFTELRKSYGSEPDILSVHRALNFAENMADIADEPFKAKSWVTALLTLPAESIKRLLSRRPLIEIHRLRDRIPAGGRLEKAIIRLFDP